MYPFWGAVPFGIGVRMNDLLAIPGSSRPQLAAELRQHHERWQKAHRELSVITSELGHYRRSIGAHEKHIRKHGNDERAKSRLAALLDAEDALAARHRTADFWYASELRGYWKSALQMIPLLAEDMRSVVVQILSSKGTLRISFIYRYERASWVLSPNGDIRRERRED